MKKFLAVVGLSLTVVTSCKKEDAPGEQRTSTTPSALVVSKTQNEECVRLAEACTGWQEQIVVNDNINYGMQSASSPESDFWLTGFTSGAALQVRINGKLYAAGEGGQWFDRANGLNAYYGKNVTVSIGNGHDSMVETIYVPLPLKATGLYKDSTYNLVHRTGNTLYWTPDPNSTTGKVAISYQNLQGRGGPGTTPLGRLEYLIVDDNGSFNMDPYIAPEANSFDVSFCRGNGLAFQNGAKKVLFGITSIDSHSYLILE